MITTILWSHLCIVDIFIRNFWRKCVLLFFGLLMMCELGLKGWIIICLANLLKGWFQPLGKKVNCFSCLFFKAEVGG